jgi:hypothetical protein
MPKLYTDSEIEAILRSYPRLKSQSIIEQERLYDVFPNCISVSDGSPRASGISRQTESYGIKNATQNDYTIAKTTQICRQVRVIELAFESLKADWRDLVKVHYYQRLSKTETMFTLNISRDQFDRYKRSALNEINEILSKTCQKADNFAV